MSIENNTKVFFFIQKVILMNIKIVVLSYFFEYQFKNENY